VKLADEAIDVHCAGWDSHHKCNTQTGDWLEDSLSAAQSARRAIKRWQTKPVAPSTLLTKAGRHFL